MLAGPLLRFPQGHAQLRAQQPQVQPLARRLRLSRPAFDFLQKGFQLGFLLFQRRRAHRGQLIVVPRQAHERGVHRAKLGVQGEVALYPPLKLAHCAATFGKSTQRRSLNDCTMALTVSWLLAPS